MDNTWSSLVMELIRYWFKAGRGLMYRSLTDNTWRCKYFNTKILFTFLQFVEKNIFRLAQF